MGDPTLSEALPDESARELYRAVLYDAQTLLRPGRQMGEYTDV